MTLVDYSSNVFVLLNAARIIAYIPQLISLHRNPEGARSVSVATWMLFAAANLATTGYALVVLYDMMMATLFGFSAAGCLLIALVTLSKRLRHRQAHSRMSLSPRSPRESLQVMAHGTRRTPASL